MDIAGIPLAHRTLDHVIERGVSDYPDRTALIDPSCSISYGSARDAALRIAGGLAGCGLGRGGSALLMLDNHVDSALCWLALGLTARVEVAINTAYRGGMLSHLITDSQADLLIVEERYLPRLIEIAEDIPKLRTVILRRSPVGAPADGSLEQAARRWTVRPFDDLRTASPAAPERVNPWDLFSVTYTSGTTGRSKGVLCAHAHAFGQATADGIGTSHPSEVRYIVLPQFHGAGRWGGVYHALIHGATGYIAPAFSASRYWEQARAAGARTSQLIGTMADFLRRQPERSTDRDHGLREICILPLPPALDAWKERFGVDVTTSYGSTESGAIVQTTRTTTRSVGRPREGYDVRIFDENDVEVPPGQVGEAVVRPALPWTTSTGYLGRHEETAAAWRNGWLHTGDALYRDEDGNFFFVDRLDDSIRRRGENISSVEVEMHVGAHPAIAECAAVAVASEYEEDEIKVAIVLKADATLSGEELIAFLAPDMPAFMVPRYIHVVAELPRTVTAKVRKREIRAAGIAGCWDSSTHAIVSAEPA